MSPDLREWREGCTRMQALHVPKTVPLHTRREVAEPNVQQRTAALTRIEVQHGTAASVIKTDDAMP